MEPPTTCEDKYFCTIFKYFTYIGGTFLAILCKFQDGNDFLIRVKISNVTLQGRPFQDKAPTHTSMKMNILQSVIAEKKLPPHKLPFILTLEKVSENLK